MFDIDNIIRTAEKYLPTENHLPIWGVMTMSPEAIAEVFGKDREDKKDVSHIEVGDDDNFYDVVAAVRDMVLNSSLDAGETEAMMDAIDHICDAHGNDLSIIKDDYRKLKDEYYRKIKENLDNQVRLELVAKLLGLIKEARKNGVIDTNTTVKITPNQVCFYKDGCEDDKKRTYSVASI